MSTKITNLYGRTAFEEFGRESDQENQPLFRFGRFPGDGDIDAVGAGLDTQPAPAARSTGYDLSSPATPESILNRAQLDPAKFKFLVCDPIRPGEEPDPCPLCRENPYAYVPDYRMMGNGDTFFNGKNCTQNIVLTFTAPGVSATSTQLTRDGSRAVTKLATGPSVSELSSNSFQEAEKERAVRLMLDYFNKASEVTVFKYVEVIPDDDSRNKRYGLPFDASLATAVVVGGAVGGVVGAAAAVVGVTSIAALGVAGQALFPDPIPGYDIISEEIDLVEALIKLATYEYHIPIQKKARTRVVVSVPVEVFERIPERLVIGEQDEEELQTRLEVTFEGSQFVPTLKRIEKAFNVYQKENQRWATYEGGRFVTAKNNNAASTSNPNVSSPSRSATNDNEFKRDYLNLEKEANRVAAFRSRITSWIRRPDIGFSFSPLKPNKVPEKITFKFEKVSDDSENIRLKEIIFNKPGCERIRVTRTGKHKNLFRALMKDGEKIFEDTRTLYYIGAGPEIDTDLTARTPTPWIKVVTDYTVPALEVVYGSNGNTIYNQEDIAQCLVTGTSTDKDFDNLMSGLENSILSAPDLFLNKFTGNDATSCNTQEAGLKEVGATFVGGAEDIAVAAGQLFDANLERARERIERTDPYLYIVLDEIVAAFGPNGPDAEYREIKKGVINNKDLDYTSEQRKKIKSAVKDGYAAQEKDEEKLLWRRVNNRLGWCGWLAIIKSAADCVAQGMGQESSTKALAAAAFGAMSDNYLNRSFLGLPPEEQRKILDTIEREVGDLPAPWDLDYQEGNYSGKGFSLRMRALAKELDKPDGVFPRPDGTTREQAVKELEEAGLTFGGVTGAQIGRADETIETSNVFGPAYGDITIDIDGNTLKKLREYNKRTLNELQSTGGFGLDEEGSLAFNQGAPSTGAGGSYGEAAGDIQKEIVDAYRRTMLKQVGADQLLESLNRIPGAPIVARLFKHSSCKIESPLKANPRIDNFLNTLEADICQWDVDLTLPSLSVNIGIFFQDIFMRLLQALTETIVDTAIAVMAQVLKFIVDKLLSLACDTLKSLGANLADLADENNHFKNLLRENICPDASDDQMIGALRDLFAALGARDATCLEQLSNSEMADFIDDLSLMLTQGQILQLLTGSATSDTLTLAVEVALTSDSECIRDIFSEPESFQKFFPPLGNLMPTIDEMKEVFDTYPPILLQPVYPCSPETLDRINDLRCELLAQKGLSKEECREQLDDLKDKAIQDLNDLLNLLNNGPFADFPALMSDDSCPNSGFMNPNDPITGDFNAAVTEVLFERIEQSHVQDLMGPINYFTGRGGVLNGVLSDTMGRPFLKHNWLVRHFGSPLAEDLGFFEWNSDNAIKDPDEGFFQPAGIDKYGNKLANEYGKGNSWFGTSAGGYPPTVAAHLAKQLRDIEPEFKTVNTAPNSLSDLEQTKETNEERITRRKKYVRAFIDEFEFRSGGPLFVKSPNKFNLAADELLAACDDVIFGKRLDKDDLKHKNESPQQRLFKVLNGKNISVAGQLVGNKKPSKWSSSAKKKLPFNASAAKSFVDFYGDRARLLELPDTSSADVRLKYVTYPRENNNGKEIGDPNYEVSVEYDYNLYDEETRLLKEGNEYALKIVETFRPDTGGNLSKKDLKKSGDDVPPKSIYKGKKEYSYTSYDLKIPASQDIDIDNIIREIDMPANANSIDGSYQLEVLYQFFLDNIAKNSSISRREVRQIARDSGFRRHFADGLDGQASGFDQISGAFLKRISYLISTGDAGKNNKVKTPDGYDVSRGKEKDNEERNELIGLNSFAESFRFGYDPYREPKVVYMDNEKYGGLLGKLYPDLVPPPFYVKARRFEGWMDIAEALVPELDGCDPKSTPIFDLTDLKNDVATLTNQLVRDDRLESDPLCAIEAPFDRILSNEDAANIEGAIRATIRIYALDAMIRGIPVFTAFELNDNNYDGLLNAFLAERMRQGLYQDGVPRSGVTSNEYYYRFLEQVVNNTVRKIDSGILRRETEPGLADGDFSPAEEQALTDIIKAVNQFYVKYDGKLGSLSDVAIKTQDVFQRTFTGAGRSSTVVGIGSGSTKFSKPFAKKAKQSAFEETVGNNENSASILLGFYIREELVKLKSKFSDVLPPLVSNIDHLFCVNSEWIRGAVYSDGPFNVQEDPSDASKFNIGPLVPDSQGSASEDSYWPFILEKYIRIEDKAVPPSEIADRKSSLYGVVNINDWSRFVKRKKSEGLKGKISKYWGNPKRDGETLAIENHTHTYEIDTDGNGVTSTHRDAAGNEHYHEIRNFEIERSRLNPSDNGHRHELPTEGWKFGLRICYMPEPSSNNQTAFAAVTRNISQDTVMDTKAYKVTNRDGKQRYLIPIASAELPIPDQAFNKFDPKSYDVYCLIEELVKTPEYKTMFKYVFPLPRFTSILSIYNVMTFFDAIGNSGFPSQGGDLWEVAGGKRGKKFVKWDRGPNAFFDSRQAAKIVFTSLYEATQAIDFDTSNASDPPNQTESLREKLKPKVNFEDGLRWWERGKLMPNRPFNKDGDECD